MVKNISKSSTQGTQIIIIKMVSLLVESMFWMVFLDVQWNICFDDLWDTNFCKHDFCWSLILHSDGYDDPISFFIPNNFFLILLHMHINWWTNYNQCDDTKAQYIQSSDPWTTIIHVNLDWFMSFKSLAVSNDNNTNRNSELRKNSQLILELELELVLTQPKSD